MLKAYTDAVKFDQVGDVSYEEPRTPLVMYMRVCICVCVHVNFDQVGDASYEEPRTPLVMYMCVCMRVYVCMSILTRLATLRTRSHARLW